jgi:hypothetical protein
VSAQPEPTRTAREVEAAADRARTERLLEQVAADDLAEHRDRVGVLSSPVGRACRAPW